jgi:hypothetical protein
MKKVIGLAVLMLTGLTAFAAPMARPAVYQKTAIVAHKNFRKGSHRRNIKKAQMARKAQFRNQQFRNHR